MELEQPAAQTMILLVSLELGDELVGVLGGVVMALHLADRALLQRRADPDRAAACCTALVTAPASDIDGRYFDRRKPHPFPRRVLDPGQRERVLQHGQDLADRATG
jgi:hypothetical protein